MVKKKRGLTLKSPGGVRKLLARLINKILEDPTDEDIVVLRTAAYACGPLLKCFEVGDFADRLSKLEEKKDVEFKPIIGS